MGEVDRKLPVLIDIQCLRWVTEGTIIRTNRIATKTFLRLALPFILQSFFLNTLPLSIPSFHSLDVTLMLLLDSGLPLLKLCQILFDSLLRLGNVGLILRVLGFRMRWKFPEHKLGVSIEVKVRHLEISILLADGCLGEQHLSRT